jgi:hypothetical protein
MSVQFFDMTGFVNGVADHYERTRGVRVDESAREALIEPALPHSRSVAEAIATGTVTQEFLQGCVFQVLDMAKSLIQATLIDGASVREAMRRYCPYIFWC